LGVRRGGKEEEGRGRGKGYEYGRKGGRGGISEPSITSGNPGGRDGGRANCSTGGRDGF